MKAMSFLLIVDQKRYNSLFNYPRDVDNIVRDEYPMKITSALDLLIST